MSNNHNALRNSGSIKVFVFFALVGVGAIVTVCTITRMRANAEVAEWTSEQTVPSVSVLKPKVGAAGELMLPARLTAWAEAPVYARTNGYLKSWDVDIGTPVKKDQILAEIDTPEIDHDLAAARAAFTRVQADLQLAKANLDRSNQLVKSNAISQQDADEKRSAVSSLNAQASQAEAEVQRLVTTSGFKHVVAPFDGIVTSRATDVGALITDSSSTPPLFTISDITKLRLYVNVPEIYASQMADGLTASFTIPELPDQKFDAVLEKTSGAIDSSSGTMLVQLVVDNTDGQLKPGSYAQLHFDLSSAKPSLRVPASAILFRKEGVSVATLDKDNKANVKQVTIGRDFGAEVEITQGIEADDTIIDSPPDSLVTGDPVRPLEPDKENPVTDKPADKTIPAPDKK